MSANPGVFNARGAPAILGLSVLALASLRAVAADAQSIPLPDPTRWDYVSVDAQSHRLYVAHRERVDVIDTQGGKPVLQLSPTPGVHGAAAAPDLGKVFTSNGGDDSVGVFDAASGKAIGKVKAGQVLATSASPGRPEFAGADGHGRVYFNIEDKGELAVLDAATLKIERHYSLAPCESPSGLAIDPQGRLYSVCENGLLVVSDPAQGKVLAKAAIGRGPDGVAWMDGKAYSANGQDGTISVVAETAPGRFETVATLPTARGARTIAADASLHELFTPTADFKPQAEGEQGKKRPEAVPGSFRVLVVKAP